MRPYFRTGFLVLAAMLLVLGTAKSALAVPPPDAGCTTLGGTTVDIGGGVVECQIPAAGSPHPVNSGPITVNETLHFLANAVVKTNAALNIHVLGDLVLDAGSGIDANNPGSCPRRGFAVTLTVDEDITTVPTSFIRSNSCSGGDIVINNGPKNLIDIDGLVESVGSSPGTGGNQAPGGGPITITSSCDLTVTDDGKVSSRGQDPGADLVQLRAGCKLHIFGLVESTGVGHGQPTNPANHCAQGAHPATTACVLLVGGDEVIINGILPHKGEVKADIGPAPGKVPWIDIFSRGPIQIQNNGIGPFAVHANSVGGTNNTGGAVTVKSRDSFVSATGLAISANALGNGGDGGRILVEAKSDVDLRDDGRFEARGATLGTGPAGGNINIRSFGSTPPSIGSIRAGAASVLDVRGGNPVNGVVNLTACLAIDFPATGSVIPNPPTFQSATRTSVTGVCGGNPEIPAYIGALPEFCPCVEEACVQGTASVGGGQGLVTVNGTGLQTVASVFFSLTCAGGTAGSNIQVTPGGTTLTVTPPSVPPNNYKVILNLQNGSSVCLGGTVPL